MIVVRDTLTLELVGDSRLEVKLPDGTRVEINGPSREIVLWQMGLPFFSHCYGVGSEYEPRKSVFLPQAIPQQPQHQGSLSDQLVLLRQAANRLGLYDACDWIDNAWDSTFIKPKTKERSNR